MHFLRGSGVAGLRGMLPQMPLSDYRALSERMAGMGPELILVRPLLGIRRADIEAYCADHALEPRIDRSNADTTFHRNRLRHELLPILRRINPAIDEILVHTADVMAGDFEILAEATQSALGRVEVDARLESDSTVAEVRYLAGGVAPASYRLAARHNAGSSRAPPAQLAQYQLGAHRRRSSRWSRGQHRRLGHHRGRAVLDGRLRHAVHRTGRRRNAGRGASGPGTAIAQHLGLDPISAGAGG